MEWSPFTAPPTTEPGTSTPLGGDTGRPFPGDPPTEPLALPLSPPPDHSEATQYHSPAKIASQEALRQAGVTEITVDDLPTCFKGLRAWHAGRRINKLNNSLKAVDEQEGGTKWQQGALAGEAYDYTTGLFPASSREWREAQRGVIKQGAYGVASHLETTRATLPTFENGIYRIDPETGKSAIRAENGSLAHVDKATRKSIAREEKRYKKTVDAKHHAEHELAGLSEEEAAALREKLTAKRDVHTKRLRKVHLAQDLKPVRQAARKAYRAEVRKAWLRRTDTSLAHREAFYEDLGDTLRHNVRRDRDAAEPRLMRTRLFHKERQADSTPLDKHERRTRRVEDITSGVEWLARTRGGWHNNRYEYERDVADSFDITDAPSALRGGTLKRLNQVVNRRKKIEELADRYKDHQSVTRRRSGTNGHGGVRHKLVRKRLNADRKNLAVARQTHEFITKVEARRSPLSE